MLIHYPDIVRAIPISFDFAAEPPSAQCSVIALGKSARYMLHRFFAQYPRYASCDVLAIYPEALADTLKLPPQTIEVLSTHPQLSEKSFAAGKALIDFVQAHQTITTFICLLSGGASALAEWSDNPAEHEAYWRTLLYAGLPIEEMNRRRIARSHIKGGRLTAFAPGALWHTFVMSDIPSENGYLLTGSMPFWEQGNPRHRLSLIADSSTLHRHISEQIRAQGIAIRHHTERFSGIVAELAGRICEQKAGLQKKEALLITGEPTLALTGAAPGCGGRMGHLALLLATQLASHETLYALSSDGIDGNSPFAGAVITPEKRQLFDVHAISAYLEHFDSYTFLEQYGCTVRSGYTGINLNDFILLTAQ